MAFNSYQHNHNTFNTSHTVTSFSSALSWLSFPSFPLLDDFLFNSMENMMSKRSRKQPKTSLFESEEVSSSEWEFIDITEPEEDLIYRMHRLIGDRWDLIAGRIPGRKAEEIERFWIMKNNEEYAERRKLINNKKKSKISS